MKINKNRISGIRYWKMMTFALKKRVENVLKRLDPHCNLKVIISFLQGLHAVQNICTVAEIMIYSERKPDPCIYMKRTIIWSKDR